MRQLAQAVLRGDILADDETRKILADAEAVQQRREQEWLNQVDEDLGPPPGDLTARLAELDAKTTAAKGNLAEAAATELPDVPADKLAESTRARWETLIANTVIPPATRDALVDLLAGDGTTIKQATAALAASRWTVSLWLKRLEADGIARVDGKGRGARWRLTGPPAGDSA